MKFMNRSIFSLAAFAALGTLVAACGAEQAVDEDDGVATPEGAGADDDALDDGALDDEEGEGAVATSESAVSGCNACPAGQTCISPGTCLKRVRVGACSGGNRFISRRVASINPASYGWHEYTPWVGGGDSVFCARKQIHKSWNTAQIYRECKSGSLYDTWYSGQRVKRQRGISSVRFGHLGTCGMGLTYHAWSSWARY